MIEASEIVLGILTIILFVSILLFICLGLPWFICEKYPEMQEEWSFTSFYTHKITTAYDNEGNEFKIRRRDHDGLLVVSLQHDSYWHFETTVTRRTPNEPWEKAIKRAMRGSIKARDTHIRKTKEKEEKDKQRIEKAGDVGDVLLRMSMKDDTPEGLI